MGTWFVHVLGVGTARFRDTLLPVLHPALCDDSVALGGA